jgi:thiamine biosynthesis protein ThiS
MILPVSEASATILLNGEPKPLVPGETVADLIERLGLATSPCAVELNRRVVPRRDHASTSLAADDRLEIVTLVGGG